MGAFSSLAFLDAAGFALAPGATVEVRREDADYRYLLLAGAAADYASTPDSAAASVAGDIDIRAKVAAADWTPVGSQSFVGKYLDTGNQRSYLLSVRSDGALQLDWSANGTAIISKVSTAATGLADGAAKWVRATLDVDNGAAGNDVKFYLSDDGLVWAQLGATVTTAGVTGIFDSTAVLQVSNYAAGAGAQPFGGRVYYAEVRSGINGAVVAAFDPTTDGAVGATSWTSSRTGEVWTLAGAATIGQEPAQGSIAALSADEAGAVPLRNPLVADAKGRLGFYAPGSARGYAVSVAQGGQVLTLRNQATGSMARRDATTYAGTLLGAASAPAARAVLGLSTGFVQRLYLDAVEKANVGDPETPLMGYVLPAGTLSAGRGIRTTAFGRYANNANAKIIWMLWGTGGAGWGLTVSRAGFWFLKFIWLYKGVGVQTGRVLMKDATTTTEAAACFAFNNGNQNEATDLFIRVSGDGVASGDITQEGFEVELLN